MISSEMKNAKSNPKKNVKAFVRDKNAPLLPAPPSEVGLNGWLFQNVFQSMSDFSSLSASIKSILIAIFTVFVFYSLNKTIVFERKAKNIFFLQYKIINHIFA